MTIQVNYVPTRVDLSSLAIEAAEELEKSKKNIKTEFKSVIALSKILKESFSEEIGESQFDYRLDHTFVFSKALNISGMASPHKKTISEIAQEARKIASLLDLNKNKSKEADLNRLISFCVALSDSASLYNEEIEELKKHIA